MPINGNTSPTIRALSVIEAQIRAGMSKDAIRALLAGVGWAGAAIDEAFLAVDWAHSILSAGTGAQIPQDSRIPKLSVVESSIGKPPSMPSRESLMAIDQVLHQGGREEHVRTLLAGVGWDARTIEEALLAVEWRDKAPANAPRPATSAGQSAPSSVPKEPPLPIPPPRTASPLGPLPIAPVSTPPAKPAMPPPLFAQKPPAPPAPATAPIPSSMLQKPLADVRPPAPTAPESLIPKTPLTPPPTADIPAPPKPVVPVATPQNPARPAPAPIRHDAPLSAMTTRMPQNPNATVIMPKRGHRILSTLVWFVVWILLIAGVIAALYYFRNIPVLAKIQQLQIFLDMIASLVAKLESVLKF